MKFWAHTSRLTTTLGPVRPVGLQFLFIWLHQSPASIHLHEIHPVTMWTILSVGGAEKSPIDANEHSSFSVATKTGTILFEHLHAMKLAHPHPHRYARSQLHAQRSKPLAGGSDSRRYTLVRPSQAHINNKRVSYYICLNIVIFLSAPLKAIPNEKLYASCGQSPRTLRRSTIISPNKPNWVKTCHQRHGIRFFLPLLLLYSVRFGAIES